MNTFVDVISENAERHPNKTALVDESGSYTYQELDRLSNGVAAKLIGQGIGTGDIVPILMSRGKAFVAAFIGVMKSGAAFVPLDINYPEERIKSIEESVEAKIVIDDEWMKDVAPSDEFINNSKPDDMAFIIFTSGSTGKPKGVIKTHNSLIASIDARISDCSFGAKDTFAIISGLNVIGGIEDICTYLTQGATIYIASDIVRKNPKLLSEWFSDNKIEGVLSNPTFAKIMLENYHVNLKYISLVGEKITPIRKSTTRIICQYGCSEFSPAVINPDVKLNESPAIGYPVFKTNSYIIDEKNFIVAKGNVGELCLVGPQMASGYWKMPELTAEKFVHCPFLPGDVKMYKTGDLARYREDGNIELVGRKDFQIKIRGFRIEPGEIENVAVKYDGIETVVVVAKEMGNEKQLVLYYTSNAQVDEKRLKEYLSKYLADYMVPNFYVHLDEMPRNANGKIDRCALPEPSFRHTDIMLMTDEERTVFSAVSKCLNYSGFSITDRFADLGISSLGIITIASTLTKSGYNISVHDFEIYDNIKSMASHLYDAYTPLNDRIAKEDKSSCGENRKVQISSSPYTKYRVLLKKCVHAYQYAITILKTTRLNPKALFQFFHYNSIKEIINGNVLIPTPYCIFDISRSAIINKKGISVFGFKMSFPTSHIESRLLVRDGARMDLNNNFFTVGTEISVFENAHISFGEGSGSNSFLSIVCRDTIQIGAHVAIGNHVTIRDNNGGHSMNLPFYRKSSPICIGDSVWVCSNCFILSGVLIGEGSVLGACSVVTNNVPQHSLVFGNPAKVCAESITWHL